LHITAKLAALAAAAALPLAMASTASAAPAAPHPVIWHTSTIRPATTGERLYAQGEAGYAADGAQFRLAAESAYLRNPAQYAAITDNVGEGELLAQDSESGWQISIGVSEATTGGTVYNPAFFVLKGSTQKSGPYTNDTWCPAGGTCAPLTEADGFAVGDTVHQSIYYDQATGVVQYSMTDAAGNSARGTYSVGKGVSFGVALMGPFWDQDVFTAPTAATKLFSLSSAALTTYSGSHSGLSSWFSHSKVIGTSDGTPTGTVEAVPSDLGSNGSSFSTSFEPVS
jgi:hypothetical protein